MIKKTIFQGLIIVSGFFLIWFGFSQLDFMKLFKVQERTEKVEHKLGDMIWNEIQDSEDVITNDTIVKSLDKLLKPLFDANDIDRDSLKVHIVVKDEINALAIYLMILQWCRW